MLDKRIREGFRSMAAKKEKGEKRLECKPENSTSSVVEFQKGVRKKDSGIPKIHPSLSHKSLIRANHH